MHLILFIDIKFSLCFIPNRYSAIPKNNPNEVVRLISSIGSTNLSVIKNGTMINGIRKIYLLIILSIATLF